jgi:glycine betaine/proline transport system ATP-binding protein
MNQTNVLMEVRNVTKIFGGDGARALQMVNEGISKDEIQERTGAVVGVNRASFSVERGEFFVIMGLSGSGKSTLIRCLIRLIEPTDGEILIDGDDVTKLNEQGMREVRRSKVAMVFQHYGLLPHKTVIENAEYGLKTRGVPFEERRRLAQSAVDRVGLNGWENYRPSALSGGMQQRVGLARALSHNPDLLLMDEPFSGLDPIVRRRMQREFARLQEEEDLTTILVTHDLDEALMLGDRIAVMRDGEIIQIATPQELVTNPADDYVESFVEGASPTQYMTAENMMDSDVITMREDESNLSPVIEAVRSRRERGGFVVSPNNELRGRVNVNALIEAQRDGDGADWSRKIKPATTTEPDVPVSELFPLVIKTRYPVAVVDSNGILLGQVTKNRMLEALAQDVDQDGLDEEEMNETMNAEKAVDM